MISCCNQKAQKGTDTGWWWKEIVLCAHLEEVMWKGMETTDIAYFGRKTNGGTKRYIKLTWHDLEKPPNSLFWGNLDKPIAAFTEVDEKWFSWQPNSLITYHAFIILEIDNAGWFGEKLFILLERCSDSLQLLFGLGAEVHLFVRQFYANGRPRNVRQCTPQPRKELTKLVTMRMLLEWMDTVVARDWRPYNLLAKNCQHFVAEVETYLLDPTEVWRRHRVRKELQDKEESMISARSWNLEWFRRDDLQESSDDEDGREKAWSFPLNFFGGVTPRAVKTG